MDRHNWNFPNPGYYYHDNYSLAYQEGGQHISQPETGQTSGEVVASGSSSNYLAPSQPQPYPDFNFSPWIPPSPSLGSDLEYLLRTPQPTPLENIGQNDVLSNAQPTVKKRQRRSFAEVKEELLAGLNKYAQGYTLKACSATLNFPSYITHDGYLQMEGTALYNKLEQKDKERVDQALEDRKVVYSLNSTRMNIMEGLEAYASGVPLKKCSTSLSFSKYFTTDGHLLQKGNRLYDGLNQEGRDQVDQALKDRKENSDKVKKGFLEGLEAYARGAPLTKCSATIPFQAYASAKGHLYGPGKFQYDRLEERDKNRVIDALNARREIYYGRIATNDTAMERFFGGLEAYANGATLQDCSPYIRFSNYVTTDGHLLKEGKGLYNKLDRDGKSWVDQMLTTRRRMAAEQISGDLPHFLAALEPYSNGLDLQTCGKKSDLKVKRERYQRVERYLTPEGGLTAKGKLLIENLPPNEQADVLSKVGRRKQFIDPSAQPVPESPPWQLPSSMLDMRERDQAEMHDPMQTEAMRATAWQLTGQAVPGPSTSAEPPIPYYDSEVVRADFQYPLWPVQTDSTEPPQQPGNRGPYADQNP
jgi:hypothetical protein